MKFVTVAVLIFGTAMAQRPSYAGSGPKGYPELGSRFRDPNETSTAVPLSNRISEDGTTARIPVDALGDGGLVDRLNQWPREHRPFWLLNADHIEAARNPQGNQQQQDFQAQPNADRTGSAFLQRGSSVQRQFDGFDTNSQQQNSGFGLDRTQQQNNNGFRLNNNNFKSRSNFDYEPYNVQQQETRPIRPVEQRSSFLGALQ